MRRSVAAGGCMLCLFVGYRLCDLFARMAVNEPSGNPGGNGYAECDCDASEEYGHEFLGEYFGVDDVSE